MWGQGQGPSAGRREPNSVQWAGGTGSGAIRVGTTEKVASELCAGLARESYLRDWLFWWLHSLLSVFSVKARRERIGGASTNESCHWPACALRLGPFM